MNLLDVYFQGQKVGILKEHNSRLSFSYLDGVNFSIAHQLPIEKKTFGDKETRGFFTNLLPEGDVAKKIAQIKQFSVNNPFVFLKELGGECAGAVSLYPQDMVPEFDNTLVEISPAEIAHLLKKLPQTPLLTGNGVRLSLAGAQEKLALATRPNDEKYYKPSDRYISTLIIKPDSQNYADLIYNEYFCMKLASLVGLKVADCRLETFGDIKAYITTRFDRIYEPQENDMIARRIHQEDFCQGLGLSGKKYQRTEGGQSIKQCFNFIHQFFTNKAQDELFFLNSVIFNFLIGNSDAHGKNFSFLHLQEGYVLAPLYDLVATQVYEQLATEMSMSVGGEYRPDSIRRSHFISLAKELNIKPQMIENLLDKMADLVLSKATYLKDDLAEKNCYSKVFESICRLIERRTSQIR